MFDWQNYLVLAQSLGAVNDEASQRTALSRAYYAVYHVAFERVLAVGHRIPADEKVSTHKWCWDIYRNAVDAGCKQLGLDGDRLKGKRVKADYYAEDIKKLYETVLETLDEAARIRAAILALGPGLPPVPPAPPQQKSA